MSILIVSCEHRPVSPWYLAHLPHHSRESGNPGPQARRLPWMPASGFLCETGCGDDWIVSGSIIAGRLWGGVALSWPARSSFCRPQRGSSQVVDGGEGKDVGSVTSHGRAPGTAEPVETLHGAEHGFNRGAPARHQVVPTPPP